MKIFKNILVPIDFSACSAQAMRVAASLSSDHTAAVCLLHVSEPINYTLPPSYHIGVLPNPFDVLDDAEAWLADAKKDAEALGIRQVTTRHLQGSPAAAIIEFAYKNGFDLIVMGTHGSTGLRRMLLGSVTERVVRTASCPVLTVHAAAAVEVMPGVTKAKVA
jgi:nucleotide-binding universal stress UspA family protein